MTTSTLATAIIPARFNATRFPGKMLADETGKPLIVHVVEATRRARQIGDVIVATDDDRIARAVHACGVETVMTRRDHANGTSRIAEVIAAKGDRIGDCVVNVQGDEPEIDPGLLDRLVDLMQSDPSVEMATLAGPFADHEDPDDPNITKVVCGENGRALYFSRACIPFDRDHEGVTVLKHAGTYAYRRDFVLRYAEMKSTPLERAEKLEQLRVLEHGHAIAVVVAAIRHHGIDTPEQYAAFVQRYRRSVSGE